MDILGYALRLGDFLKFSFASTNSKNEFVSGCKYLHSLSEFVFHTKVRLSELVLMGNESPQVLRDLEYGIAAMATNLVSNAWP